jgi:flagellar hook-associated protein FlgK
MMDIFGVLSMGSKALMVQQRAIHVTGNNIANVAMCRRTAVSGQRATA